MLKLLLAAILHVVFPSCFHSFSNIHLSAGFSLITNMTIMDIDSEKEPPSHREVMETANQRAKDLQILVATLAAKLADKGLNN